MEVQKRDLEILNFCLEQKFATLLQIGKMFFPDSQDVFHRPAKRVCELVNAGLLKAEHLRVCEKKLYVTTREGVKLLKLSKLESGLHAVDGLDTRTWEHDEQVTEVRIIFNRLLGLREWVPERILKQKAVRQKVPDGLVKYFNQKFAIEVERTLKNKDYYEKIFNSPYIRQDGILYIMESEGDKKWLMGQAEDFKEIYFITIQHLKRMPYGHAPFENTDRDLLEMRLDGPGCVHFNDSLDQTPEDYNADHDDGFDDLRAGDDEFRALKDAHKKLIAQGLSESEINKALDNLKVERITIAR